MGREAGKNEAADRLYCRPRRVQMGSRVSSMARGQRQRIEPTEDWQQIALLTASAEQRTYELLRPVVLFGRSPAERARETGAPERTLYRQAARFHAYGMASLFPPPRVTRHRRLPDHIRRAILALKAEHALLNAREIA